jgi:hypothetical protein
MQRGGEGNVGVKVLTKNVGYLREIEHPFYIARA